MAAHVCGVRFDGAPPEHCPDPGAHRNYAIVPRPVAIPDQPEMMRTALGTRIIARAAGEDDLGDVVMIIAGLMIGLELEESARLRGLLQAAEDTERRRRAPDDTA